ncbi:MAG: dihydrolipoyl dehydrogenase family protein [Candidatus Kariarchaeaceae archaeon]|jgi:pyruvate/2-oxoglutarate dehydrogenase complex dihydrolipoamide dehydrogenase (E3) component
MEYDYDLVTIGSGSAGRSVAVRMKRQGWKTAIVEKDVKGHFGGTCINTGCIPTKALISKISQTGSFEIAKEHQHRIVERINKGTLKSVKDKVGVDVIEGFATFVDDYTIEINGRKYTSEIFVIATGSESAIPPIKGLKEANYSTSLEMLNLNQPPQDLLIIGGGRIGLEIAWMLNSLGTNVTVFEGMDQILPGEDTEMADLITEYLTSHGIKIYKGRFVDEVSEAIEDGKKKFKVHLTDGRHIGVYSGDTLLVATGRIPRTSKLNLENTSVKLKRSAVDVNEFFQSSSPNIASNLAKSKSNDGSWLPLKERNIPRLTFIEPELASVGLTETEARQKYGDDVVVFRYRNKWLGKSMIVDDWDGVLKGIGIKGSNEILGAHLWGKRTGSLIQTLILAMDNGLGWEEVSDMIYGHPVLVEGIYSLSLNMKNLAMK